MLESNRCSTCLFRVPREAWNQDRIDWVEWYPETGFGLPLRSEAFAVMPASRCGQILRLLPACFWSGATTLSYG